MSLDGTKKNMKTKLVGLEPTTFGLTVQDNDHSAKLLPVLRSSIYNSLLYVVVNLPRMSHCKCIYLVNNDTFVYLDKF